MRIFGNLKNAVLRIGQMSKCHGVNSFYIYICICTLQNDYDRIEEKQWLTRRKGEVLKKAENCNESRST